MKDVYFSTCYSFIVSIPFSLCRIPIRMLLVIKNFLKLSVYILSLHSFNNYNELLIDIVCYHFQPNNLVMIYSVIVMIYMLLQNLHKTLLLKLLVAM